MKKNNYYKKKYNIIFYDKDDEVYLCSFNNCLEICQYKGDDPTPHNLNVIQSALCRALQRKDHYTTLLNGKPMRVYLVDLENEDLESNDLLLNKNNKNKEK